MKIFLFLFAVMLISKPSCADLYVVYNSSTKAVTSISSQDDAQVESGQEKMILNGDRITRGLDLEAEFYKVVGSTIVVDGLKLAEEASRQQAVADEQAKKGVDFESLKAKLIGLGLTADEVDSLK